MTIEKELADLRVAIETHSGIMTQVVDELKARRDARDETPSEDIPEDTKPVTTKKVTKKKATKKTATKTKPTPEVVEDEAITVEELSEMAQTYATGNKDGASKIRKFLSSRGLTKLAQLDDADRNKLAANMGANK